MSDDGRSGTSEGHPTSRPQPDSTGLPQGDAELVPGPAGPLAQGTGETRTTDIVVIGPGDGGSGPPPADPDGPPVIRGGGPPVVRDGGPAVINMRRSVLIWILCLLAVALLTVAALVLLRPERAGAPAATPSKTTGPGGRGPARASGSPGASASPSASGSPSTGPSPSPSATPAGSSAPGAVPGQASTNLFTLKLVENNFTGNFATGPEQIGTTSYPNSVRFTCQTQPGGTTSLVYDVAGFKFLTAVIGVPSDATNAAGNTMTITFFKDGTTAQLGTTITTTLDHPRPVHLNLEGASQLEIACAATSNATHNAASMDVVLGNAAVGSS